MKCIVCDLDGTLYPKDDVSGELFNKNKLAVHEWIKKGNLFAVATSRGIGHYPMIIEKLDKNICFLGSNGAESVYDDGHKVLKTIKSSIFVDLCNLVLNNKLNASVTTIYDGHWYWLNKECYPIKDAKKIRSAWNHIETIDVNTFDQILDLTQIKILTLPEKLVELQNRIKELYGDSLHIVSSDVDAIDIGASTATKGAAIKDMCDYYHLSIDNVIAIGDSENDIAMFNVAGNSYCIDHASEEVKKSAKHVVKSVEEVIQIELK